MFAYFCEWKSVDLDKQFKCDLILLSILLFLGFQEQLNTHFFFRKFNSAKKLSKSVSTESNLAETLLQTKSTIPPPS